MIEESLDCFAVQLIECTVVAAELQKGRRTTDLNMFR